MKIIPRYLVVTLRLTLSAYLIKYACGDSLFSGVALLILGPSLHTCHSTNKATLNDTGICGQYESTITNSLNAKIRQYRQQFINYVTGWHGELMMMVIGIYIINQMTLLDLREKPDSTRTRMAWFFHASQIANSCCRRFVVATACFVK